MTEKEILTFRKDGAAFLPNAVEPAWLEKLLQLVEEDLANPGRWVNDANPGNTLNRMFTDRYMWKENPVIKSFVFESGCAKLAGQAMDASKVRFYFDHLLVKEPETPTPTPWHQDIPYWPFKGKQVCSIWLALTSSTVEESALEFVRGSHLHDKYYMPELFGKREEHPNAWTEQADGEPVPDINANREAFDIIGYDVEPGDAVIFSAWLLHGARGNNSSHKRRAALSTRWLGDDAIWWPKQGSDPTVTQADVSIQPGEYPADDDVFPLIWQAK